MENLKWIFDGIGSQIVGLLIGFVVGGASGYSIAIHKNSMKLSQKQSGDNYANQQQTGIINNYGSK